MNAKNQRLIIYGVGGLALGTLGYFGFKKIQKKLKNKKAVTNYSNATVNTPSGTINIVETARQLGMDLGFAYPSWDPRSWTENDDAALATLKKVPKTLMPKVALEYFKQFNRNLQQDCQKVLDGYSQIAYLFQ